jgi:hypothetical protein
MNRVINEGIDRQIMAAERGNTETDIQNFDADSTSRNMIDTRHDQTHRARLFYLVFSANAASRIG